MKFFGWMQNKLAGKQEVSNKQNGTSQRHNQKLYEERKEEFSDWPNALLAIGTFGNNDLKENPQSCDTENNQSSTDEKQSDFSPEEVGKLQKELTKLLSRKPKASECEMSEDGLGLPLDQFLNCPSSLEVDRRNCNTFCEDSDEKDDGISNTVALGTSKDVRMDKSMSIHKKSVTFLLKKMFACSGGFGPTPSLADPIPESRMEKLLRAMLHKKMHTQSSTAPSAKKYLGDRRYPKSNTDDQTEERSNSSSKWVKTDSEYIVLEI